MCTPTHMHSKYMLVLKEEKLKKKTQYLARSYELHTESQLLKRPKHNLHELNSNFGKACFKIKLNKRAADTGSLAKVLLSLCKGIQFFALHLDMKQTLGGKSRNTMELLKSM